MGDALPLSNVRVLDLTRLLPGPYATLVMADLGARVDKLEDPQGGDYLRQMPPQRGDESALFLALNRNKRSIALDLKRPEAVAAVKRLAGHYNVVIESFRPGVMAKLGLGWDALHALHPRLIVCSISGYGQTGPDRLRAGHDLGYVARAGVLGYGGAPGGPPAHLGVQVADIGGGSLFSLVGILAALHERARTGQGRWLDISMTEGSMAFLHMHLAARLVMGAQGAPLRRGVESLNGGYPCYGLYRTKDGRYLAVGALEPKFWTGLCALLERPDLAPLGWDTGEEGAAARRQLEAIFASATAGEWRARFAQVDLCVEVVSEGDDASLEDPQHLARGVFAEGPDGQRHLRTPLRMGEAPPATAGEWRARFAQVDLCVEVVSEGDDVLEDPQHLARGVFAEGPDGQRHLRTPLRMGEAPLGPVPALGQHTEEILREAGFGADEIAHIR